MNSGWIRLGVRGELAGERKLEGKIVEGSAELEQEVELEEVSGGMAVGDCGPEAAATAAAAAAWGRRRHEGDWRRGAMVAARWRVAAAATMAMSS